MIEYQFWDEPQTEADLARAEEQGRVATERQLRADIVATRRILAMQERPWCRDCGKRQATKVHYGRLRCDVCDPVVIEVSEADETPDEAMHAILESVCAYCGNTFEMTPDRQRYCSPECYQRFRADGQPLGPDGKPYQKNPHPKSAAAKRARKVRLAPDEASAAATFLQTGTPIQSVARMYSMGSSGALLKELARHGLAS